VEQYRRGEAKPTAVVKDQEAIVVQGLQVVGKERRHAVNSSAVGFLTISNRTVGGREAGCCRKRKKTDENSRPARYMV